MSNLLLFSASFLSLCLTLLAHSQETHLSEQGSSAIFARSAFAHGYRHGYEEGYHLGNIDINMVRPFRSKKNQFHRLSLGYSAGFGDKKLFEEGFAAGVRAGYRDGYAGASFRAVDSLRAIAVDLDSGSPADPTRTYFDRGLVSGYHDGFGHGESTGATGSSPDFRNVGCTPTGSERPEDFSQDESYCEGYRRGFVLGYADALALASGSRHTLEASN